MVVYISVRLSLHRTGSKRIQMDPVGNSDWIGLLFTWDLSGTGPLFCRSSFGSFWIRSGPIPERTRVNTWIGSKWFHVKQKPIWSGSARNGSDPVPCKHSLLVPWYVLNGYDQLATFTTGYYDHVQSLFYVRTLCRTMAE